MTLPWDCHRRVIVVLALNLTLTLPLEPVATYP